jgi:hypothetical protein
MCPVYWYPSHTHTHTATATHTDTDTHAHIDTYEYLVYIYCSQHNPLWRFYSPSSYTCWILQMDLFKIEPHEPRDSLSWSGLNHPNWRNLSFWLILSDPQLHAVFPQHIAASFLLKTLFDYLKHTQSWDNHDTWHLDISHIFSNHHTFGAIESPFARSDGLSLSCSICFSSSNRTCSMPGPETCQKPWNKSWEMTLYDKLWYKKWSFMILYK